MKGFAVLALLAALAFVNCQDEVEPSNDSTAQQETTTASATTKKFISDLDRCREAFGLHKDEPMPFPITKTKCATVCIYFTRSRRIPENEGQDCEYSDWVWRKRPGKCAKGQCIQTGRRR